MRRVSAAAALVALFGVGVWLAARSDPSSRPTAGRPSLAFGLLEGNPFLLQPGAVPAAFVASRDRITALRPRYVRVLIDWEKLQPARDIPPSLRVAADGCSRGVGPCAPHDGAADVLRALAQRQADDPGFWEPVVVIYGTPVWAAGAGAAPDGTGGCAVGSRARAPDLDAYRALVVAVREQAAALGVRLRWWAPWNEPNHPAFLGPQRDLCSPESPTRAADAYAQIVRAWRSARAPGDRLLLGELAGYDTPRAQATSVDEFIAALPRDVVCGSDLWAQHIYVRQGEVERELLDGDEPSLAGDPRADGRPALLQAILAALDARGCRQTHRMWLTETGVGGPRPGRDRSTDVVALSQACGALARAVRQWQRLDRVDVAIQYSVRDDPAFPVGLFAADLRQVYPAYRVWQALSRGGGGCPGP